MGTVAARYTENGQLLNVLLSLNESRHRLAIVAGTSTRHIVQSRDGVFVKGVCEAHIRTLLFPAG